MTTYRAGRIGRRALQATGALLAGAALSSCAISIPPTTTGTSTPPQPASAPGTSTGSAQSSTTDSGNQGNTGNQGNDETTSTKSHAPATARCHTSMLTLSLGRLDVGAGQRSTTLWLRNGSSQTCDLYGFAGLQLLGPSGERIPTNVTREQTQPRLLRLAPGEAASATLAWTGIEADDEPHGGNCEPHPSQVLITPPDERDGLLAAWPSGSQVCQHGGISVTAFQQ